MNTPPGTSERERAPAPVLARDDTARAPLGQRLPLSRRLPDMSGYRLIAHHLAASRIAGETHHPKNATARRALYLIEAELRRRSIDTDVCDPLEEDLE